MRCSRLIVFKTHLMACGTLINTKCIKLFFFLIDGLEILSTLISKSVAVNEPQLKWLNLNRKKPTLMREILLPGYGRGTDGRHTLRSVLLNLILSPLSSNFHIVNAHYVTMCRTETWLADMYFNNLY